MFDDMTLERFWRKIEVRGEDDCWPWMAAKSEDGYGRFTINRRFRPAARVAWEIHHQKPFPDGKLACHSCDNPPCVNPNHIWPGTQSENIKDCANKGRHPSKRLTECKRGHPMTDDNRMPTTGGFRCRACEKISAPIRWKRWNERRKMKSG